MHVGYSQGLSIQWEPQTLWNQDSSQWCIISPLKSKTVHWSTRIQNDRKVSGMIFINTYYVTPEIKTPLKSRHYSKVTYTHTQCDPLPDRYNLDPLGVHMELAHLSHSSPLDGLPRVLWQCDPLPDQVLQAHWAGGVHLECHHKVNLRSSPLKTR